MDDLLPPSTSLPLAVAASEAVEISDDNDPLLGCSGTDGSVDQRGLAMLEWSPPPAEFMPDDPEDGSSSPCGLGRDAADDVDDVLDDA